MMQRLLVVTEITVRRLMRSRLLWIAVVGVLLVMGMFMTAIVGMVRVVASGESVPAEAVIHVIATVLTILGALATLIAVFVGVTVVRRDLEEGTVASVLSKPVSRGEYIAASYTGAAAYLLLMWGVFAVVLTLFAAAFKSFLGGPAYLAMFGNWLTCVMTMAVAMFFSIRMHPWVAVVLTFVLLRGRATVDGIASLFNALGAHVPGAVVSALKFPFPVPGTLDDLGDRLTQGSLVDHGMAAGFAHVIDYGLVMAVLAWLVFVRVEVNRARD